MSITLLFSELTLDDFEILVMHVLDNLDNYVINPKIPHQLWMAHMRPCLVRFRIQKKRKSEHHQSLDIFHLWNIYLYGRSLKCMIAYWVTLLHHTWF